MVCLSAIIAIEDAKPAGEYWCGRGGFCAGKGKAQAHASVPRLPPKTLLVKPAQVPQSCRL